MSEFFEKQRQEAEKRRLDYELYSQRTEARTQEMRLKQEIEDLQESRHSDYEEMADLVGRIDKLEQDMEVLRQEIQKLAEANLKIPSVGNKRKEEV